MDRTFRQANAVLAALNKAGRLWPAGLGMRVAKNSGEKRKNCSEEDRPSQSRHAGDSPQCVGLAVVHHARDTPINDDGNFSSTARSDQPRLTFLRVCTFSCEGEAAVGMLPPEVMTTK